MVRRPRSGHQPVRSALMGAGAEVAVTAPPDAEALTDPGMRRGFRLYPDDPDDPRCSKSTSQTTEWNRRNREEKHPPLADRMPFERRPDFLNPRPWLSGVAAAGVAAGRPQRPAPSRGLRPTARPIIRSGRH